jgi:hypothetical protein
LYENSKYHFSILAFIMMAWLIFKTNTDDIIRIEFILGTLTLNEILFIVIILVMNKIKT